jgi:hypothetical protein
MRKKLYVIVTVLVLMLIPVARSQSSSSQTSTPSHTSRELTDMLNQFLQDAARNSVPGFDRFFADDVIYTHSAGTVSNKSEIMRSVAAGARSPRPEITIKYSAEDITIHEYPDLAIFAFRLVSDEDHSAGKPPTITNYRNTGTFLRRNGKWQVIAWQSTKIPEAPMNK